jgi:GxxExxY protein
VLIDDAALNRLTGIILAAAIEVHRILGPGLPESAYVECLKHELITRGLCFVAQQPLAMQYKALRLESVYRTDLIVDDTVVEALSALAKAQLLTYIRLAKKPAGLLINFNVVRLPDGVKRVLNTTAAAQRS